MSIAPPYAFLSQQDLRINPSKEQSDSINICAMPFNCLHKYFSLMKTSLFW